MLGPHTSYLYHVHTHPTCTRPTHNLHTQVPYILHIAHLYLAYMCCLLCIHILCTHMLYMRNIRRLRIKPSFTVFNPLKNAPDAVFTIHSSLCQCLFLVSFIHRYRTRARTHTHTHAHAERERERERVYVYVPDINNSINDSVSIGQHVKADQTKRVYVFTLVHFDLVTHPNRL